MAIADSVGELEEAVGAWAAAPADAKPLIAAYNTFSRVVAVQSRALTDEQLQRRVRIHQELVGVLGQIASAGGTAAPALVPRVRSNADALLAALQAHVHGQPLPAYQEPPGNAAALVDWTPTPPAQPGEPAAVVQPGPRWRFWRLRRS